MTRFLPLLLFIATALSGQPPTDRPIQDLATLRFIDLVEGTGAPAAPGKRFTVHYTGWLKDGSKFDSSVDRNTPFEFVQGRRQVIAGWDVGFEGMKVGGRRRLIVPYQFAYGEAGRGKIPPKAELIFDVELLGVSDIPATPAAIDLLLPYADLETRILSLAKTASPAKASTLKAIDDANRKTLALANNDPVADPSPGPLAEQLAAGFTAVHRQLESASAGYLSGDAEVQGKPSSRRGLFTALIANIAEQLGTLKGNE